MENIMQEDIKEQLATLLNRADDNQMAEEMEKDILLFSELVAFIQSRLNQSDGPLWRMSMISPLSEVGLARLYDKALHAKGMDPALRNHLIIRSAQLKVKAIHGLEDPSFLTENDIAHFLSFSSYASERNEPFSPETRYAHARLLQAIIDHAIPHLNPQLEASLHFVLSVSLREGNVFCPIFQTAQHALLTNASLQHVKEEILRRSIDDNVIRALTEKDPVKDAMIRDELTIALESCVRALSDVWNTWKNDYGSYRLTFFGLLHEKGLTKHTAFDTTREGKPRTRFDHPDLKKLTKIFKEVVAPFFEQLDPVYKQIIKMREKRELYTIDGYIGLRGLFNAPDLPHLTAQQRAVLIAETEKLHDLRREWIAKMLDLRERVVGKTHDLVVPYDAYLRYAQATYQTGITEEQKAALAGRLFPAL